MFITGTNCSGKTTLARALIQRSGGIAETGKALTVCKDRRICLAGPYDLQKQYGGVDSINNTRSLPGIAEEALKEHDVLICEGSMLDTFGPNLVSTIYQGDRRLVVILYTPLDVLSTRLFARSRGVLKPSIVAKQKRVLKNARKYCDYGCETVLYDTQYRTPDEIADDVYKYIIKQ